VLRKGADSLLGMLIVVITLTTQWRLAASLVDTVIIMMRMSREITCLRRLRCEKSKHTKNSLKLFPLKLLPKYFPL